MDADLKAQADALFAELGMNLSTAFNIFVRQSLREGGIPFEVRSLHGPRPCHHHDVPAGLELFLVQAVDLPDAA